MTDVLKLADAVAALKVSLLQLATADLRYLRNKGGWQHRGPRDPHRTGRYKAYSKKRDRMPSINRVGVHQARLGRGGSRHAFSIPVSPH